MSQKVIIIGDSGVGKTSIINRYTYGKYGDDVQPTLGASFKNKDVQFEHEDATKMIRLSLWDTAGQEKFNSLNLLYFKKANAAIIVYDVTDR